MNDSSDLERLLTSWEPGRYDARELPRAFGRVVRWLDEHRVDYVVVGRVAMARYCPAQFTEMIELRCGPVTREADAGGISSALQHEVRQATGSTSTVSLRLCFAQTAAEAGYIRSVQPVRWFGLDVKIAGPEYLLWVLSASEGIQDAVSAVGLIRSGHLDLELAKSMVRTASAPGATRRLGVALRRADKEAAGPQDYSEASAKRLAAGGTTRTIVRDLVTKQAD